MSAPKRASTPSISIRPRARREPSDRNHGNDGDQRHLARIRTGRAQGNVGHAERRHESDSRIARRRQTHHARGRPCAPRPGARAARGRAGVLDRRGRRTRRPTRCGGHRRCAARRARQRGRRPAPAALRTSRHLRPDRPRPAPAGRDRRRGREHRWRSRWLRAEDGDGRGIPFGGAHRRARRPVRTAEAALGHVCEGPARRPRRRPTCSPRKPRRKPGSRL